MHLLSARTRGCHAATGLFAMHGLIFRQGSASTHKTLALRSFGSANQNYGRSLENKGIPEKRWKTTKGGRPNLTRYSKSICDSQEFLVCNQEVGGSIPVVSTYP
jgi:hypothetical protein